MAEPYFLKYDFFFLLFSLYLLTFLILHFYYWVLFRRLAFYKENLKGSTISGVSVVICARNEYCHLKENLPLILEQDHPMYEVVVVNHASDDDSSYLLARFAEHYSHLKIVEIKQNLNFFTGKKFPLSIGIKSASYEHIILTDADCRPAGKNWLSLMQGSFSPGTEIVLGYGAYERRKGLLNKLIRFDTIHIAIQYLSCTLAGMPYMGVGRNMAYLKSVFYRNNGFISHYRINSGDDDLFINRVANRGNTRIIINPESFTTSEPKNRFSDWLLQKRRHVSTYYYYKPGHKILLGTYALSQFFFSLLFVLLLLFNYHLITVLSIYFLRLVSQMFIFAKCMVRLQEKKSWIFLPFFELFFLLFNGFVPAINLFSKPDRWK